MKAWNVLLLILAVVGMTFSAQAQDPEATANGDWDDPTIWSTGTVPDGTNNVYISPSFTVAVTQDQTANNLYVEYGSVLNLGNNHLAVGSSLAIWGGAIVEGPGGSFSASKLSAGGTSFTFGGNDQVANLDLEGGSVTTSNTANITTGATVDYGGVLNLGADASWSDTLTMQYSNPTLNMNGHAISANRIELGERYDDELVTINRGGPGGTIAAHDLIVNHIGSTPFDLGAGDNVTNFELFNTNTTLHSNVSYLELEQGSVGNTTPQGNITYGFQIYTGGTLNLGADMTLSGSANVEDAGSTVNLNGHALTADGIDLGMLDGQPVTLNRGGPGGTITATSLGVGYATFDLLATDSVKTFYLFHATSTLHSNVSTLGVEAGSVATTTAGGNVTSYVDIETGSTLNLGADMNLTNGIGFQAASGSTVNLNGHAIVADSITFYGDVTLNRGGPGGTLTAGYFYLGNSSFDLSPADTVTNFYLTDASTTLHTSVSFVHLESGSTVTTTAADSVRGLVQVYSGSTLRLGADLNLSGALYVRDVASSVAANGHNVTASEIDLGYNSTDPVVVHDVGTVSTHYVMLDHGSSLTIHGGVISDFLGLLNGSTLTVFETGGSGLTFGQANGYGPVIDSSSLNLVFNSTGWGFRWQDPYGSNWIGTLEAMIAANQIQLGATVGGAFSVYDLGGYTYIGYTAAPEPASFALAGLGGLLVGGGAVKSRRRLPARA